MHIDKRPDTWKHSPLSHKYFPIVGIESTTYLLLANLPCNEDEVFKYYPKGSCVLYEYIMKKFTVL